MPGWMKRKLESRLLGEISTTSDMQMTPPLWQKGKGTKEPVDNGERGEWKSCHPVSSLHGKQMRKPWKEWETLFSWAPKSLLMVTAEIKRRLLLGRKAMTSLDSILKSRDITLPTKVCLVKTMVFPVVMYLCESYTIRKLSNEELILLKCGVGENFWESLGRQGDQTSQC